MSTARQFFLRHLHLCCGVLLILCTPAQADDDRIELVLNGAGKRLAGNIRAHLDLATLPCDISPLHLRSKLKAADGQLSEATRALGYYQAKWQIQHEQTGPADAPECWRITIAMEPGERVTIAALDITVDGDGADDPVFTDYLARLPVKPGDALNHGDYEQIKTAIAQRARNAGYLEGRYTRQRLQVNTDTNTATLVLHYVSGPRYNFGPVTFSDTPLGQPLLYSLMPFRSGEPFSTEQLIQFQSNLISSQYFDVVDVDQGEPAADSREVPIQVTLTARSRYQTTVGLGFSTDIGPRVSYGLDNRRVNRDGDTYRLDTQWSPVESHIAYSYQQPGDNPLKEKRVWALGLQQEDTDTARSTSYTAEVSEVTQLDNKWLETLSLKYLYEEFDIGDDEDAAMVLLPGIRYSRSQADDFRYPRHGWRLSGAVRGAYKGLLSDLSLAQAELDGKLILPLGRGRLLTRAGVAATAVDEFATLPVSLRYFAGGDNSIRGWAYESLGPTDSDGNVIGGKHRITASVEVDYPVKGSYSAAVFYDTGSAFDTQEFTLYQSVGVGARWFSPIGPIRLDLAFPLDDGGFRIHFSMGPDL